MVWAKEFAVIKASEIGIVRNSLAECLTWKFLYAEFGRVSLPEGEGQSNFVRVCWWCSLNKLLILALMLSGLAVHAQIKYQPTPENIKSREWFEDARFGLFIHCHHIDAFFPQVLPVRCPVDMRKQAASLALLVEGEARCVCPGAVCLQHVDGS